MNPLAILAAAFTPFAVAVAYDLYDRRRRARSEWRDIDERDAAAVALRTTFAASSSRARSGGHVPTEHTGSSWSRRPIPLRRGGGVGQLDHFI